MSPSKRKLIALVLVVLMLISLLPLLVAEEINMPGVAMKGSRSKDSILAPHISISKTPQEQEINIGDTAVFTISVTNTGEVLLTNIVVDDPASPACNRDNISPLAPGVTHQYSCSQTNVTTNFLNEVTVTALGNGDTVADSDRAYVKLVNPVLNIAKSPATQTIRSGERADFTITVENTSPNINLVNVQVVDPFVPECNTSPFNLAPGEQRIYSCSLSNVNSAFTNVGNVQATDPISGTLFIDGDSARVELLALNVGLQAQPTSLPEPGGLISYTVTTTNPGSIPVTLTSLATDKFGELLGGDNHEQIISNTCPPGGGFPALPANGGAYVCGFEAIIQEIPPSDYVVTLTATAADQNNNSINAVDSAVVTITDLPSSIDVTITADPAFIVVPGGTINYDVRVTNTSEVDSILIDSITDSLLGDLNGVGTCTIPGAPLTPGSIFECTFEDIFTGDAGESLTRTITVVGQDDDNPPNMVQDSNETTVTITGQKVENIYLSMIADDVDEPNDSCLEAYPLTLNRAYYFLPDDEQDVYRFTLESSGKVRIELSNFIPLLGQLVIWKGECGGLEFLDRDPSMGLDKVVDLGNESPGNYIIQVINDGIISSSEFYKLVVIFE